jgi:Zn-dependent protease/CBS domain-containing protein
MEAFKIGRIFGIDIRIHWSWLAIFFLLLWWLAEGFYGGVDAYNHWSAAERWFASGITTILFFVSILLHELSHSLVARRLGLPVHSITLFIFGGVSSLTQEPDSPGQEFKMAIVGPLTSFALGIIAGAIAAGFWANGSDDTVPGAVAAYLAFINIAVGIFNMLPGYPLDGGRVLRASLWARTGTILRATRWASGVGTIIAFGLMALGVVSALAGNWLGGVWFIVIGWFLRNTSEQAYQQLLYRNTLEGTKVGDIVDGSFEGAPPDIPLSELVNQYILGRGQRCVPIVVENNLLGLITMADLRRFPSDAWTTTSAFRAMTPREQLHTVASDDELVSALELMAANDVNQLPVIDGFDFSGFVTRADVIRRIQVKAELASLRD